MFGRTIRYIPSEYLKPQTQNNINIDGLQICDICILQPIRR